MHVNDLDPSSYPQRELVRYDGQQYLISFKDLAAVHVFRHEGQGRIHSVGCIDCAATMQNGTLEFAVCQAIKSNGTQLQAGLEELKVSLTRNLCLAQELNQRDGTRSRELSLAVTKLEEAIMWLGKAIK